MLLFTAIMWPVTCEQAVRAVWADQLELADEAIMCWYLYPHMIYEMLFR
jgi:hypothetical protein